MQYRLAQVSAKEERVQVRVGARTAPGLQRREAAPHWDGGLGLRRTVVSTFCRMPVDPDTIALITFSMYK